MLCVVPLLPIQAFAGDLAISAALLCLGAAAAELSPTSAPHPAAPPRPQATRAAPAPAGLPRGGSSSFLGSHPALAAALAVQRQQQQRGRRCCSGSRRGGLAAQAMLTYKEAATGIEFPLVQKLWLGDEMRCVGAGCRWAGSGWGQGRHCCFPRCSRASCGGRQLPAALPAARAPR
jgi:hypothetical protein